MRIASAAPAFIFVLFLAIAAIAGGFGVHGLAHLAKAQDLLAHSKECSATLSLTTPPSQSVPCPIAHGTIQSAYVDERGSNTGAHDEYRVVFAPSGGGKPVDAYIGEDFDSQTRDAFDTTEAKPGAAAVAEYVDGEVYDVVDQFGAFGPAFDPSATGLGWILVALGVFFAVLGIAIFGSSLLPKKR